MRTLDLIVAEVKLGARSGEKSTGSTLGRRTWGQIGACC